MLTACAAGVPHGSRHNEAARVLAEASLATSATDRPPRLTWRQTPIRRHECALLSASAHCTSSQRLAMRSRQMQQVYFSDAQLAERYQVSRSMIWRWTARGHLPSPVQLSPAALAGSRTRLNAAKPRSRSSPRNARAQGTAPRGGARGRGESTSSGNITIISQTEPRDWQECRTCGSRIHGALFTLDYCLRCARAPPRGCAGMSSTLFVYCGTLCACKPACPIPCC